MSSDFAQASESAAPDPQQDIKPITTWRRRLMRFGRQTLRCSGWLIAIYGLIVVVGLIPVNNDFRPAVSGVEIYLISTAIHADIVMPLSTKDIDWRDSFPRELFAGDVDHANHIAIGWGDKSFFVDTPTWQEFRWSTAAQAAFLPTDSCLHVTLRRAPTGADVRRISISAEQYANLVRDIQDQFVYDQQSQLISAAVGYGSNDAFFAAKGGYHALNTCNNWAGRRLQRAGVRMPRFSPLPHTNFLYLH